MKMSNTLVFKHATTAVIMALTLLAPLRAGYIEECVDKKQRPDRAALFYDLPECVKAFEYRQK